MDTSMLALTRAVAVALADELKVETVVSGDLMFGHSVRFKFGAEQWETGASISRCDWDLGRNGGVATPSHGSVKHLEGGADADVATIVGFVIEEMRAHLPTWPTDGLFVRFFGHTAAA